MNDKARHLIAVACLVLAGAGILLLVLLFALAPKVNRPGGVGASTDVQLIESRQFAVDGDVRELLSPGKTVPLDLRFRNSHGRRMVVGQLRVTLRVVHAPRATKSHPCTGSDFTVQQASSTFEVMVPARSTRPLSSLGVSSKRWPQVGMLNLPVNQDGCKGSTVALNYRAAGRLI